MKVNRFVGFMLVISTIVILGEALRMISDIALWLAIVIGIIFIPYVMVGLGGILRKIKY